MLRLLFLDASSKHPRSQLVIPVGLALPVAVVLMCALAVGCAQTEDAGLPSPGSALSGTEGGDNPGFAGGGPGITRPADQGDDQSGDQGTGPEKPTRPGGTVSQGDELDGKCGHGTVYGVVCSKPQQIYVNDASVWIDATDCDGEELTISTVSDGQGYYTLEGVPSGLQTVNVEKEGFTHTYTVMVKDSMLTDVTGVGHKECFKAVKPCPVGGMWGYVCHQDGTPFGAGADIAIDGAGCDGAEEHYETATDDAGNFFFANLHTGSWSVTVAADGLWLSYDVTIEEGQVADVKDIGVDLCVPDLKCGEGTIKGYACAPDEAWYVGGAQITVTGTGCEGQPYELSTFSDASGVYTLTGVPSGPATVTVEKDDLSITYDVNVPADGVVDVADVVSELCFPAQCIPGSITGYACAPGLDFFIGGAKVWVDTLDCDGKPAHVETFTDAGGVYVLQNVPPGDVVVHVQKGGFVKEYALTVKAGQMIKAQDLVSDLCFPPGQDECADGNITGYVCAPNGTTKIGGAHVWTKAFDCKGNQVVIDTFTDDAGNFELKGVPAGETKVFIQKGSFETEYVVTVPEGGTVHAPDVVEDTCFPDDQVKIAVITGNWDSIEQILDQLGFKYDLYDGVFLTNQSKQLLTNLSKMSEYDIIFFDCGANHSDILSFNTTLIVQNLQNFVGGGGSIYASDWAFVYAEWPWPNAIDFYGGNMNAGGPKVGAKGKIVGTVSDAGLAGFVGKTKVEINFDLSAWVVVTGAPAATTVHISGSVPQAGNNAPLMVSHTPGAGKVLYTTFHNEYQVTGDMVKILNYLVFVL